MSTATRVISTRTSPVLALPFVIMTLLTTVNRATGLQVSLESVAQSQVKRGSKEAPDVIGVILASYAGASVVSAG